MTSDLPLFLLVVEDDSNDMSQLKRDLPPTLKDVPLCYDFCDSFEDAFKKVGSRRYDLILSDTYKGQFKQRNAEALKLVKQYREGRFCPLVLFSNGTMPQGLITSDFVHWVEKDKIEEAVEKVLATGIPQLARRLHAELDRSAGGYLWDFLEEKWNDLKDMDGPVLERLVKRRAATQFADLVCDSDSMQVIDEIVGLECYIYPAIPQDGYCLGDVVRNKRKKEDMGVLLTPHCHVTIQPGKKVPRADHVLVARLRPFKDVLEEEGPEAWKGNKSKKLDKLRRRTQLPAEIGQPRGRYCFLPGFMDIPDCYCDLMGLTSVPIGDMAKYERLATLVSPFAEAVQSCLTRFYGAVGVPSIQQESIERLIG